MYYVYVLFICNSYAAGSPLYILFLFADYVVRLHVAERYLYNTGSYATVITLILYVHICIIRVHKQLL